MRLITKIKNTDLSAIHTFMRWRTTYKKNIVIFKMITLSTHKAFILEVQVTD